MGVGVLWRDITKTSALASFDNETVYMGDGFFREQIGRYDCGGIYDKFGNIVAKFVDNTAFLPYRFSTEALCTFDSGTIYKGGSAWTGSTLAVYDGEPYGACAAAVLFFKLYASSKTDNTMKTDTGNMRENIAAFPKESAKGCNLNIDLLPATSIVFVVGIIATLVFYFTEWGRDMVFGEDFGILVFFMSLLCAVIGFFIIYKSTIEDFAAITVCVASSYLFVFIGIFVFGLIDLADKGGLSFGYVLLTLFGSILGTGVAGPFCLIEIIAVCIAKRLKKRN